MLNNEWVNWFQVINQLKFPQVTEEYRSKAETNTKSDLHICNETKDTLLVVFFFKVTNPFMIGDLLSAQSIAHQRINSINWSYGLHWCQQVLIIFGHDCIQKYKKRGNWNKSGSYENVHLVCHTLIYTYCRRKCRKLYRYCNIFEMLSLPCIPSFP